MGYQVKFYQLRCIETEDNGEDELWVDFRGQRVWGRGDINNGQVINVNNGPFSLVNSGADVVSLWDQDDFDPDDHLGDFHISPAVSGRGEQVAEFRGDGAHYTLTYEVRPDNW
ncbi:hypothetical protein ACFVXC_31630 [Streptomyces sp. NPDC058257]|uniref:hypothetical protein n=1 Tax=Streptomyces sp. NPDC058257 TaxID=3346409 RepID=UPI0036DFA4D4